MSELERITVKEIDGSRYFSCGNLIFQSLPAYALHGLESQQISPDDGPALWLHYRGVTAFFGYQAQESSVLPAALFPVGSYLSFHGKSGNDGWLAQLLIKRYLDHGILKGFNRIMRFLLSWFICRRLGMSIGERENYKIIFP